MPELATTIMATVRGHDEIGLGTILGSNIFNGLLIVGVASLICPIRVSLRAMADALILGLVTTALTYPNRSGLIERRRGPILLALLRHLRRRPRLALSAASLRTREAQGKCASAPQNDALM